MTDNRIDLKFTVDTLRHKVEISVETQAGGNTFVIPLELWQTLEAMRSTRYYEESSNIFALYPDQVELSRAETALRREFGLHPVSDPMGRNKDYFDDFEVWSPSAIKSEGTRENPIPIDDEDQEVEWINNEPPRQLDLTDPRVFRPLPPSHNQLALIVEEQEETLMEPPTRIFDEENKENFI